MDMRDLILKQHEQITHSLEVSKDVRVEGTFDSIILAGMGGSGHPGDLLNALGLPSVPLYVHRNYDLPLEYLEHMKLTSPLVITSSYSGNTEEALTSYRLAQEKKLSLLVSSAGGTLQEWATRDNVPFCHIDYQDMQPRHTLFAAFTGIATALKNSELADDATEDLLRIAEVLEKETPRLETKGKKLAEQIQGKVPVFTSSDSLGFATKNFKIQTNENAKYPAFWNTFPELNHNELVGFSKLQEGGNANQFFALMIRDPQEHPRNKARIDVTADLYREWGMTVEEFEAKGETQLEKILYTETLGLWTTYYLATIRGIDPVPVEGVESFKAKLKEVAGEI